MADDSVRGSVVVTHDIGLHARPSVKLTKLAKSFASAIELAASAEGPWIDAKSINKVMKLKARRDTELFFRATGRDSGAALSALLSLVSRDFEDERTDG
jgi:phosphocarrier protein